MSEREREKRSSGGQRGATHSEALIGVKAATDEAGRRRDAEARGEMGRRSSELAL